MSYGCDLVYPAGMTTLVMDNLLERYRFLVRPVGSNPLHELVSLFHIICWYIYNSDDRRNDLHYHPENV